MYPRMRLDSVKMLNSCAKMRDQVKIPLDISAKGTYNIIGTCNEALGN